MRIKITTTFIDLQAEDPENAEIPAGKEITCSAERGQQLIDLRLAEPLDAEPLDPAPSEPLDPAPSEPTTKK